uniref:Capsid protein n=1 Tax=Marmot associated feces virus 2 TaxID=2800897 RepID=A0A7T7DFU6_9VIRU|nr:capsid protein [Marmot associated feces virus 2]
MAYRRKRTMGRRRSRRPVFGKKATKAIMAISQRPVETKTYTISADFDTFMAGAGYTGGNNYAIRGNIFAPIARADTPLIQSEHEVIGNELMARGFRWNLDLYSNVAGVFKVRFTCYSYTSFTPGLPLFNPVSNTDDVLDPEFPVQNLIATEFRYNPQRVNILKQKTWVFGAGGSSGFIGNMKVWVPIKGKKISAEEEGTVLSTTFNRLKGRNYYWVRRCWELISRILAIVLMELSELRYILRTLNIYTQSSLIFIFHAGRRAPWVHFSAPAATNQFNFQHTIYFEH